jgi:hypothetical protein
MSDEIAFTITFFDDHVAARKREEVCTLEAVVDLIRSATAARKDQLPWLKLARFGEQRTEKGARPYTDRQIDVLARIGEKVDHLLRATWAAGA